MPRGGLGVGDGLVRVTGNVTGTPLHEISNSIYVPHDKLVHADHSSAPGPDSYGLELVSLLFADDEPAATHNYNLIISNPSVASQAYEVALTPSPCTVQVIITPTQARGLLASGEIYRIPMQLCIGPPLILLPPR